MSKIYKVVNIPDQYSVVINAGRNEDIDVGDVLEIFAVGKEVIDPESKKVLGTLDKIKAKLEVKIVYDYMCLCVNQDKGLAYMKSLNDELKGLKPYLNIDKSQLSGYLESFDDVIRLGDNVRKPL